MEFLFIAFMEERKKLSQSIRHSSSFSILPLFLQEGSKRSTRQFSTKKNNDFINYVLCRNWAVRNPAGTRLYSSSLVNKQVGVYSVLCIVNCEL